MLKPHEGPVAPLGACIEVFQTILYKCPFKSNECLSVLFKKKKKKK